MSLQPPQAVFSFPPKILPVAIHLKNYADAFKTVPFDRLFLNSTIVAIMITAGKLITGTLAGYAFANFNFFGKSFAFSFLFATLFLPAELIMIVPLFSLMAKFGWVNTYWALTIPFMASATNTFLLRQHFLMIPKELEDSARIDGAGPMAYFIKILLPLSKSMIGGVSIINFIYAWNFYLWPLIITMEDKMKTVQVGVKMLIDAEGASNWGVIMAGTVSAVIPTLLVFFILQPLFVKSLTRSGIKG
jgi:sn-glycerol 3-phosphate transport system permease protein